MGKYGNLNAVNKTIMLKLSIVIFYLMFLLFHYTFILTCCSNLTFGFLILLQNPWQHPRFLDVMAKHIKPEPFDRQLRDAFKVLDKDSTGFVAVSELRHILTNIGEKLEPSEFDEWVREARSMTSFLEWFKGDSQSALACKCLKHLAKKLKI